MSATAEGYNIPSILIHSGKGGTCRVFIVQTRNQAEVGQVQQIFSELERRCSVRALSIGVTTAFAVQTAEALPLLQDIELVLKEHYKFSVVYAGFNSIIHRIVEDLAVDTGSHLLSIPLCQCCGNADPFASRLSLQGSRRKPRARAVLCGSCLARLTGETEAEEFRRLLEAVDSAAQQATEVVRKRGLLRQRLSVRLSRKERKRGAGIQAPAARSRVKGSHAEAPEADARRISKDDIYAPDAAARLAS